MKAGIHILCCLVCGAFIFSGLTWAEETSYVTYDAATRTVTHHAGLAVSNAVFAWPPSSAEENADGRGAGSPLDDFSNLALVNNSAAWPYRTWCWMQVQFPETTIQVTGTLIDAYHVMTSGSNVYDTTYGGWATSIPIIVPGRDSTTYPFGSASWISASVPEMWYNGRYMSHDVGMIRLNTPIGTRTGWLGFGTFADDAFTCSQFQCYVRLAGCPGYPYLARMYSTVGQFEFIDYYYLISTAIHFGLRGAGDAFIDGTYENYVAAIYSRTFESSNHTRIHPALFTFMANYIEDYLSPGWDLQPAYFARTRDSLQAGGSFDVSCTILNYSNESVNQTIPVRVYLSTNPTISTGDELLASFDVNVNLGGRGYMGFSSPDPVDISISHAGGNYWVGLIVDAADDNTANNDTPGLPLEIVACPQPGTPQLLPTDSTCADVLTSYRWHPAANAAEYTVSWTHLGSNRISRSTTDTVATVSLPDTGRWTWSVRAYSNCGRASATTGQSTVDVDAAAMGPVQTSPANHAVVCAPDSTHFFWWPISGVRAFVLELSRDQDFADALLIHVGGTSVWHVWDAGGTWYWRVRAEDICDGGYRSVRDLTVNSPAGDVTLVSPADGTTFDNTVNTVTFVYSHADWPWTHQLQLDDNPEFDSPRTVSIGQALQYTMPLGTDTVWYWRVRAESTCGDSLSGPWSAAWRVMIGDQLIPPLVVIRVEGANGRLMWTPIASAARYRVLYSDFPGGPFQPLGLTADTSFVVSTVEARRFFRVVASN